MFEPAPDINERIYNTNDIYGDANLNANEMPDNQNYVNWNDIDRVPSPHQEVQQDKQMPLSENAAGANHLEMAPLNQDDAVMNDKLEINNYKSPMMPMQSENLSE